MTHNDVVVGGDGTLSSTRALERGPLLVSGRPDYRGS